MSPDPRIRAGFVQGTIETIDSLGEDVGRSVRAVLKPELLENLEAASRVSWIDVDADVVLTEALFQTVGTERARQAMRQNLASAFETPLLRPMLDGARNIFSRSPANMLKWVSKIWSLLFKDCGRLELTDKTDGSACVRLRDAPPSIAESEPYLLGIEGALEGFFDAIRMEATVHRKRIGRDTLFKIHW